jgi:hypothetical protein
MGGSSKSTQTSFTSQPGVNDVLGTAKTIFNSGVPWVPDTSSHVTPFSQQTNLGLTGLTNVSKAATDPFGRNFGRVNAVVGDGGLNSLQDQQVNRLQGIANNATGLNALQLKAYNQLRPTANGLNAQQQQAYNRLDPIARGTGYNAAQQEALNYLKPIASGQARQQNPHLDEVIRRTSEDIRLNEGLNAAGMGRYASGAHQGVTQDAIGDMSADLRYQDYGQQQTRQDAAIQNLFGMGTTGIGQKMGAIGAQADLGTTGAAQRTNALNQQFGMGTTGQQQRMDAIGSLYNAGREQRQNVLAGTQQLQDAYKAQLDPYRSMLEVGQQYEGLNSRVLQDQARILQERKNALTDPVNWLANLAGAFQGGQQVQTTRTSESPFNNPLFNGLLGKVFGL